MFVSGGLGSFVLLVDTKLWSYQDQTLQNVQAVMECMNNGR